MSWTPTPHVWLAAAALLLGSAAPAAPVAGESDGWKLVQRKAAGDGYTLYSRPRAGSRYAEYRMDVVLDAEPADVMAALEQNLFDPDTYPDGFQRSIVRSDGPTVVSHDTIQVPFLADRDVVLHTEFGLEPQPGVLRIRWRSTRDDGPAPRDGVVRMPSSEGSWTVRRHEAGGTLAVYQSHVEIGGSLPTAFVEARMPAEISRQAMELHRTMRERLVARR